MLGWEYTKWSTRSGAWSEGESEWEAATRSRPARPLARGIAALVVVVQLGRVGLVDGFSVDAHMRGRWSRLSMSRLSRLSRQQHGIAATQEAMTAAKASRGRLPCSPALSGKPWARLMSNAAAVQGVRPRAAES